MLSFSTGIFWFTLYVVIFTSKYHIIARSLISVANQIKSNQIFNFYKLYIGNKTKIWCLFVFFMIG